MGRTNFMKRKVNTDVAWQGHYRIDDRSSWYEDGDLGSFYKREFYIVTVEGCHTVAGPYRDLTYAGKQARRRYKKLVRNMERALMV